LNKYGRALEKKLFYLDKKNQRLFLIYKVFFSFKAKDLQAFPGTFSSPDLLATRLY